jgi:hypothetical protein
VTVRRHFAEPQLSDGFIECRDVGEGLRTSAAKRSRLGADAAAFMGATLPGRMADARRS